jgi:indolepyruvate ferredoxin oxidoreductase alpha subunit
MKAIVTGDIGCYTLSVLPPLEVMDTCVCMGASIGTALGMKRAQSPDDRRPVVAVIGDSTFVHSGITGLIDAVYNGTAATICILDNSTTAMTGGQEHPASGKTLMGYAAPKLDLAALARAIGVEDVLVVDPYDLLAVENALTYATRTDKPSVIITNRPCVLRDRSQKPPKSSIALEMCTGCQVCFRIGCPAMESVKADDKLRARINADLCQSCGVCVQVCRFEAIGRPEE